ncbi:MAG: hypothetical protein LBT86_08340 [Deltaproteobacteria bacterium]|jgi:polar amino acid transport system permease protein|nr:hypothetical protein [Deltaproteobacteria bacterium]
MAAIQVYGPRWGRFLVSVYVWFFRGVPIPGLAVCLLFRPFRSVKKILGQLLGEKISLPLFVATLITLGLTSEVYQWRIIRGSVLSLNLGRYNTAMSRASPGSGI